MGRVIKKDSEERQKVAVEKVTEIFATSKLRVSFADKADGSRVFRFWVDHFGRNVHANVSAEDALTISNKIYENMPEEMVENNEAK